MLSFVLSWFNEISFDETVKAKKQKVPKYVHRDELEKRKSTSKLKKRINGSEAKPLIHVLNGRDCDKDDFKRKSNSSTIGQAINDQEKKGIKVKILMTKEEAARLLSKCKDGGVLEFKDVAREIVQIPTSRVNVISGSHFNDSLLQSIPEEL